MAETRKHLLGSLNVLHLEALKAVLRDVDVGDERVELVDVVLVLVSQPRQPVAHPELGLGESHPAPARGPTVVLPKVRGCS